jgi:hypothetical protein
MHHPLFSPQQKMFMPVTKMTLARAVLLRGKKNKIT